MTATSHFLRANKLTLICFDLQWSARVDKIHTSPPLPRIVYLLSDSHILGDTLPDQSRSLAPGAGRRDTLGTRLGKLLSIVNLNLNFATEPKTEGRAAFTYQNSIKASERERQRSGKSSGGWT